MTALSPDAYFVNDDDAYVTEMPFDEYDYDYDDTDYEPVDGDYDYAAEADARADFEAGWRD